MHLIFICCVHDLFSSYVKKGNRPPEHAVTDEALHVYVVCAVHGLTSTFTLCVLCVDEYLCFQERYIPTEKSGLKTSSAGITMHKRNNNIALRDIP